MILILSVQSACLQAHVIENDTAILDTKYTIAILTTKKKDLLEMTNCKLTSRNISHQFHNLTSTKQLPKAAQPKCRITILKRRISPEPSPKQSQAHAQQTCHGRASKDALRLYLPRLLAICFIHRLTLAHGEGTNGFRRRSARYWALDSLGE